MRRTFAFLPIVFLAAWPLQADPRSGSGLAEAWLGVNIGEVPPVLAVHLGLEKGSGVVIRNLVKESPADKAGLDRHDVIVSVGGEKLEDGAEKFVQEIRGRQKGDELELEVIHRGERKKVVVRLSERTSGRDLDLKYKIEPDLFLDSFDLRGRVLGRGPDGWVFKGPDHTLEFSDIEIFPGIKGKDFALRLYSSDGEKRVEIRKEDNGKVLEIHRKDDGVIWVVRKRRGEDGVEKTEKHEYKTEEDLEKHDQEAYEAFRNASEAKKRHHLPRVRLFPLDDGMVKRIESALKKTIELDPEKLKEISEIVRKSVAEKWDPAWTGIRGAFGGDKIEREFKVVEDGRVTVKIKKGKSLLETSYASLEEFEKKEPELYKHYREMLK